MAGGAAPVRVLVGVYALFLVAAAAPGLLARAEAAFTALTAGQRADSARTARTLSWCSTASRCPGWPRAGLALARTGSWPTRHTRSIQPPLPADAVAAPIPFRGRPGRQPAQTRLKGRPITTFDPERYKQRYAL